MNLDRIEKITDSIFYAALAIALIVLAIYADDKGWSIFFAFVSGMHTLSLLIELRKLSSRK